MNKNLAILIILVFVIPFISAEQPSDFQNLVIDASLYGQLDASSSGKLTANLTLFPQEDLRQQVTAFKTFPAGEIGETIFYTWYSDVAKFGWNASLKTSAILEEIKHINFPISIKEYSDYTKASEHIDINSEIVTKANELVSGKTDLFEAVHEIGNFVYTNMTYDKSYVATVEKVSSTIQIKRGVCDEYSILFIALVRSLGIPARYVTGIVYSENTYGGFFGNHAWAEVYFPNYGWIPFDTTFGQLGWIDSTHIALSKNIDSENSVIYSYQRGVQIDAHEINITTSIVNKFNPLSGKLKISAEPVKSNVKIGSYVPLKVEIENLNNFYVPASIFFIKAPGEILGKNAKNIILGPREKATIFFIMKIPTVQPGYIYTSSIQVKSNFNDFSETDIKFSNDYDYMSLEEAESIIGELTTSKQSLVYDTDLTCRTDQDFYYLGENLSLSCIIKSKSNTLLQNLKLCAGNACRFFDLPINSEIEKNFTLYANDYLVKLSNTEVLKSIYISPRILSKPDLKIIEIKNTKLDYYNDSLDLIIETKSICNNLKLEVNNKQALLNSNNGVNNIQFEFAGKNALENKVDVKVECYDLRGIKYEDEKEIDVEIINIPWYGEIVKFFVNLF